MRIIGLIILLCNFLWLAYDAFSIKPIARVITAHTYELIDQETLDAFSKKQVKKYASDSVSEAINAMPHFIYPGIGMLIGGMLLMFSKQYVTDANNDKNT